MTRSTRPGRYRNPILPGCHPDPSICRVGDEFFIVTSTFEYLPGLPIHRSTNLVDWEPIGHVVHREGQLDLAGLPGSKGLYAPTIRHHEGRFFVVCTVVVPAPHQAAPPEGGWPRAGHFLMTADDPAGPWSDPIWFDGLDGIDPSLVFHDGRVWLCGNRLAAPGRWPGQTDIWLRELDPVTFAVIGDEHLIWHGALEGGAWAEGPHLFPRPGGGWMLVAAEGGTDRDHAVCVAYADEITGPYTGDPGNPRLSHRDLGDRAAIANVGHADLVDDADGRTWATVLGTQQLVDDAGRGANGLLGRQTHLVPVDWERGRPLFAPGIGRVHPEMAADGLPDQQPWPTELVDDFDAPELDPAWTGVAVLPASFAALGERASRVRLRATPAGPTDLEPFAFLGRRLPDHRVDATVVLELGGTGRAGLLLRTSERAHLELAVDHNGVAVATLVDEGERSVIGTLTDVPAGPVAVEARIDGLHADLFVADRPLGGVDLSSLATGRTSRFVGTWIGPFAVGDGWADVDRVELRIRR
ncbi:glycoside hydrolase family 43 protein [Agromyces larvae]|uniref:Glycoside hydrolase family 43 protein n=1 Tax=Agromyces larvae TaxID=2929802 RepID=A0ABY4C3X7_9MICO|nr:glycoside hydrolase family 43 protein [Agromyces larvae]UOE43465.1 glycoside hydrolase family 43 protein [Agromyces larvae]